MSSTAINPHRRSRQRRDVERLRRFAAAMALPDRDIRGLEVAPETVGVEQRLHRALVRKFFAQRLPSCRIGAQGHGQGFVRRDIVDD